MSGMDMIIIVGTFLGISFGMMSFLLGRMDKLFDKLSAQIEKSNTDLRHELSAMNMRIGRIEGSLNPFHPDYFHNPHHKGAGSESKKATKRK